jgi:succinylarginine dihydrolase
VLPQFGDEGAANHSRLASAHDAPGIALFAFGGSVLQDGAFVKPKKFPVRQSIEASHAIRTTHAVDDDRSLLIQQNPDAIDAGVFHNDVVAVANENVFLLHEKAFADQRSAMARIHAAWTKVSAGAPLHVLEISEREVSLEDAIRSYFFNSQLVTVDPGKMALICPEECRETPSVKRAVDGLLASGKTPVREVHYFDVRESMQNGGGPACLRLRVVLTENEAQDVHAGVWLTAERQKSLEDWIGKHYRDRLAFDDLEDPRFYLEVQTAMDALEGILGFSLA